MSVVAIIPVKPFSEGKSRLSKVLSHNKRMVLNKTMFLHVLKIALSTKAIEEVIVVSRDPNALDIAEEAGAHAILEETKSNLNQALDIARKGATILKATTILVLPSDLAKINSEDINILLQSIVKHSPSVVIAPDKKLLGTNALLIEPLDAIPFSFGEGSFKKHQEDACRAGCEIAIVKRPNLTFDVDEPSDLFFMENGK
tara:strand:- start:4010 stop:4609 length:600 start_codon:yes stop_codon:yes gene_type:complete